MTHISQTPSLTPATSSAPERAGAGTKGRTDDERLLDWLDRRPRGASSADIARLYGVTSAKVRVATNRVREADSRESGEDTSGGYWGGAA